MLVGEEDPRLLDCVAPCDCDQDALVEAVKFELEMDGS